MTVATEDVDALHARLDELTSRTAAMREQLVQAHALLVSQDEEIEQLTQKMAEELRRRDRMFKVKNDELERRGLAIDDLRARLAAAERDLAEANDEIAAMRQTRVWRAGERVWRFKARGKTPG